MSSHRHAELLLPGGLRCCVPDSNDLLTPFVLREQEDWFEDEIRLVRRLLTPGMRVLDIGANYGTYTLSMGAAVGPQGRVYAFEPASQPLTMLRRSLAVNHMDWVSLHPEGLSDHIGSASMGISMNAELNTLAGGQDSSEEVRLTTLDAQLPAFDGRIAFVKMDAEGEEERILAGAGGFIAAHEPVIMFELKHGHSINEGLCEAFMRRGFLIHRLVPGLGALAPIPLGEPLDGFLLNAFAVRPAAEDWLRSRGMLLPSRLPDAASLPQVAVQEIIHSIESSPWLPAGWADWRPNPDIPGWNEHRRAVALAVTAFSGGIEPALRYGCLRHALYAERKAMAIGVTGSRLFTAARICFDLGYRSEAVGHLQKLVEVVQGGEDLAPAFREAFLLPDRHHEGLSGLTPSRLLTLATLETYAWKAAFSAYFTGGGQRQLYERICAMPEASARSRRALELITDRQRVRAVSV